mgnify:FL=1
MAKNNSGSNFKFPYEGKNLINNNQRDNQDNSNNFESNIPREFFINENKNSQNKFIKETNLTMQPRINKNGIISKEILNPENEVDININENLEDNTKKKEKKLSASIFFYKESIIFTKFRRIYKKLQIYISIFLSIFSAILFIISLFDFMKRIKNKEDFILYNLFIFICEILCSILNIIFHIIYYSFNISSNNLIFIIISCLIFVFSSIYTYCYIKQKAELLEILFYVALNFCMILINLIYLFMSYFLTRKQFKVQQNIEDIMNFSIRNEKIEDNSPENKKERKKKGIELVEEENQNNLN